MGLLDHLFKTKSPTGEEKAGEHALETNAAAKPSEDATRTQASQRPDPSTFLHPKNSVPRGAPGLTPAPRPSSTGASKNSERRAATAGPTPAADEIVLTLGDVLSRIPTNYLKPGTHDAKRELRFKINDLSSDIARGRAAVPLSRIAQLAPEIFVKSISRDEDTEVRLPLQKLVEQIGLLRSRPKAPVAEKVARPITTTEWPSAAEPAVPGERQPETIEVPAVVAPIAPLVAPPVVPPVILAEPVAAQKAVELKPAAEQAAGSVILGPPPVVSEPAAITLAPAPPSPPPSAPAPAVPEPTPPVEPASASPIAPAPPEPPPTVREPRKIVPDWKGDLAAKSEVVLEATAPASQVPEQRTEEQYETVSEIPVPAHLAGPTRSEPFLDAPRLAPLESPKLDPSEESIHLGLAAILRTCPPEIIVGQLPHVDDSVRITLPFAPIDRQLVKGQVEVSALRFIASLPEFYQRFFVAKVGVKVPIPLEEVFQNLPSPKHELTPSFTMPPPVVLAPADPAAAAVPPATVVEEKPRELAPPVISIEAPAAEVSMSSPAPLSESAPVTPVEPPPIPPPAESSQEQAAPVPPVVPPPIPEAETAPAESVPEASEEPVTAPPAPAETPVAPPALSIAAEAEPAPAAMAETPTLFIQPPFFRPHFMPPPPLFGFTPPAAEPALEPTPAAESPSTLAPAETVATPVTPSSESIALEAAPAAIPASEAVAPMAPTVIVPVPSPVTMAAEPSKPEATVEAASEGEANADLMAIAGEHDAPDLVQFSSEPVPFSDLSETLAHETTYAPDLAEAVRIPEPETEESKTTVAEQPSSAPTDEHRPVPIVESLAATAVAATIAEHVPLHFHVGPPVIAPPKIAEPAAPAEESAAPHLAAEEAAPTEGHAPASPLDEEPKSADEATAPVEVPAVEMPVVEEPVVAENPAPPPTPAPEETTPEPETPAAHEPPPSAPPLPAIPTPPPIGLFPLPKRPVEAGPMEVLPPPALPLRRFDQDAVQALFMTEEALDLPKISHLAASLPGVYACVIATRDQACTGGTLPDGFDLAALLGLAPRVGEAAGRMPIGQLKHFTLYGDAYSVSFFERHGLSICAVHRPRSFVPGVREKLVALADELSR